MRGPPPAGVEPGDKGADTSDPATPASIPPAAEPFGCLTTGPGDPALAEAPGDAAPALLAADARRASADAHTPVGSGSGGMVGEGARGGRSGTGPDGGRAGSDCPRRKLRDLSACPPVQACVDVLLASTLTMRIGGGGPGRARSVTRVPAVIGLLSKLVELVVQVVPALCLRLCLRV